MAYIVIKDIKENLCRKLRRQLSNPDDIASRGWNLNEVQIPSELSGVLLPVNLLAYKYCPTNRDLYLKKILKVRQPPTWPSYQGRIIHELMLNVMKSCRSYSSRSRSIARVDLLKYSQERGRKFIKDSTQNIDKETSAFNQRPKRSEKNRFLKDLERLVRMESEIVSTFVDYAIATNVDVNIDSEFLRLFPFQQEICLNAEPLGLAPSVKPDFIYKPGDTLIMGEIKTGKPKEFHKIGVAAYAMAYEYAEDVPVNFGMVLNVTFQNRNVPIYKGSEAFVISDKYRKAFLELRDEKLDMLKNEIEPSRLAKKEDCNECPYISHCWGN